MSSVPSGRPSVAIVGGGLAGLAAAVALAEHDVSIELYETRRVLGGRAGSFRDPSTHELIDHCQHVSMGCCTNLTDFCRRIGIEHLFRRDHTLRFVGPDARIHCLTAAPLPAPLHLVPSLMRLGFLTLGDRLAISRATWKLMRMSTVAAETGPTIGDWLRAQRQSPRAIDLYWNVVLVSALGEQLDRASLAAARKVFIDGFLAARGAYVVEVPTAPLGELYGDKLERWLSARGVRVYLGARVNEIACKGQPRMHCIVGDAERETRPEFVIIAVPWWRLPDLIHTELACRFPWLAEVQSIAASPITGVHLWFDRPVMPFDHAVLVGRISQWVFRRNVTDDASAHYYQVVISASRDLSGQNRKEIVETVRQELAAVWPAASAARLLRSRVVTEQNAVFSTRPGLEMIRPAQQTEVPSILLAGDWTKTGWPSTMEGAVRSGYLAAEQILRSLGRSQRILRPDLPRGILARWLIRR